MLGQNRYNLSVSYKREGWLDDGVWPGDTWQDAIQNWVDDWLDIWAISYQVVSQIPSEDGRSGIMTIKDEQLPDSLVVEKVKATIIENN